jgi:opacity protein-like surface antigen
MEVAMRNLLCALAVAIAPTVASAADLAINKAPPRMAAEAPFNWSGLWIAGYGMYGANLSAADVSAMGGVLTLNGQNVETGPGVGGGLTLLYQAAQSDWVLGVRAEIGYLNMKGNSSVNNTNLPLAIGGIPANSLAISQATNYLGDFNGIVGYTFGGSRLLGYATGGLAFGGNHPNLAVFNNVNGLQAAASDTSVGWDVGLGLKYALAQNWSIGIEGNFARLGDKSLTLGNLVTSNNPLSIFTQRLEIGYKF